MANDTHTITIEPLDIHPGGGHITAVVERLNGAVVQICATSDRLAPGQNLTDEARGWARAYGAVFDEAGALASALLEA